MRHLAVAVGVVLLCGATPDARQSQGPVRPAAQTALAQVPRLKNLCDPAAAAGGNPPVPVASVDCVAPVSPSVGATLVQAEADRAAGRIAQARQEVGEALAQAASEDVMSSPAAPPPPPPTSVCPVDSNVYVKLSSARRAADTLAVAREAQLVGDAATATAATKQAAAAYRAWAEQVMRTSATTVGDYVSIARGAQLLGLDDVSRTALDNAHEVARANLRRAGVGEGGECALDDAGRECRRRAITMTLWLGVDDAGERADLQAEMTAIEQPCFAEWFGTVTVTIGSSLHTKDGPDANGVTTTNDSTDARNITITIPASGPAALTMSGEATGKQVVTDPRAGNVNTVKTSATCRGSERRDASGIIQWSDDRGEVTITIPYVTPPCHSTWDGACVGACGPDNAPTHFEGDEPDKWVVLTEVTERAARTATSLAGSKSFDEPNPFAMAKVTVKWELTRRKK